MVAAYGRRPLARRLLTWLAVAALRRARRSSLPGVADAGGDAFDGLYRRRQLRRLRQGR